MTSKIKVDNINKVSDDSNIIKKCGTTTTIGSGASNPIVVDGSAVTLGRCGGTVALASGATQTGFGRTGTVDWQTTPKTGTFTAVNGEGYFVNTSGGISTANLPAGSAGAIVSFADYKSTFQTNSFTITPNGSDKIGGQNISVILGTEGQSVTLVFVDATEGWVTTADSSENVSGNAFVVATGGTVTESGNDKIHTFTGPGTFQVTDISGTCAANNVVSYLVIAGGASGGSSGAGSGGSGGGGAGGFRELKSPTTPYTASPLDGYPSSPNRITVTKTSFPITVGAGGSGAFTPSSCKGVSGNSSIFSTITSAGGGGGGVEGAKPGNSGGSGGGGGYHPSAAGAGNTPPTTPAQGTPGGEPGGGASGYGGASGGGAAAAGAAGSPSAGGAGGAGATTSINGTPTQRAGGGGGSAWGSSGAGGAGGGGAGSGAPSPTPASGTAGTTNTGGGGGGGTSGGAAGSGGSGLVIIRYKFQ